MQGPDVKGKRTKERDQTSSAAQHSNSKGKEIHSPAEEGLEEMLEGDLGLKWKHRTNARWGLKEMQEDG